MTAQATTNTVRVSRVGKRPLSVPKGVTVNINGAQVDVQGPKGKLSFKLPPNVVAKKEGDLLKIETSAGGRDNARLQGLGRALLMNTLRGVSEGYERILELVGTGYRAEVKGKVVTLQLGFSHPTSVELPPALSANVPADSRGTMVVLSSADKELVGQYAASIRALRPPEPYGGKGIRYRGENIRRKAGKAAKGKGK
jgi:large subunit ribosomal protein L6